MASDLTPVSIGAPGFYGLNLQDSPYDLPVQYALVADNAVIDAYGRVGARKGWEPVNSSSSFGGTTPTLIHEYIKTDGSLEIIVIANYQIYTLSNGTLTSIYSGGDWTDNDWKAENFNGKVYFFQIGNDPLVYDGTTVEKIKDSSFYQVTARQANEVLAAYGRLWCADTTTDKVTIWWSDLLIGEAWSGGSSGSLNITTVLTNGVRPITALAAFNNQLVIFCDRSILIYSGAESDPATNLTLVDIIDNLGCVSRDSVVDIGSDILFMSEVGVHSLGRVIDQRSAPMLDVSFNVRDDLLAKYNGLSVNNRNKLKAVYYPLDGFYLLSLPGLNRSYCLDLKRRLDNNLCRVTTWEASYQAFCVTSDNKLYFGVPGYVAEYTGYSDNGSEYTFRYYTSHITADQPSNYKVLKKVRALIYGGAGTTLTFYWDTDYNQDYSSRTINFASSTTAEYNIAEYNVDEYGLNLPQNRAETYLTGYGLVYQLGIEAGILNNPFSLQQLDTFVKLGRTA